MHEYMHDWYSNTFTLVRACMCVCMSACIYVYMYFVCMHTHEYEVNMGSDPMQARWRVSMLLCLSLQLTCAAASDEGSSDEDRPFEYIVCLEDVRLHEGEFPSACLHAQLFTVSQWAVVNTLCCGEVMMLPIFFMGAARRQAPLGSSRAAHFFLCGTAT